MVLTGAFVNCGGFSVDQNAGLDRETFFSSRPVLLNGTQAEVTATGDADPDFYPGNPVGDTSSRTLPTGNVTLMCSWAASSGAGTNAIRVIRENKTVYIGYREDVSEGQTANLLCATVIDLRKVINDKNVTPPTCPELSVATGNPALEITTNSQPVVNDLFNWKTYSNGTLTGMVNPGNGTTRPLDLLYALNDDVPMLPTGFTNADFGDQSKCDSKASPLFLQIAPKNQLAQQLLLSSPTTGILFDILGANARPQVHAKIAISWVMPQSRRDNYFLILPDSTGGVSGIDEMFGDNTRGPDGKFAANGYEALRKYDGNDKLDGIITSARDGLIDKDDAVFSRLRLWNDLNGDGIAQTDELHGLSSLGVKAIDLNYDPSYFEIDPYGNEVRLKSTVNMEDGSINLIYDLWFALKGS